VKGVLNLLIKAFEKPIMMPKNYIRKFIRRTQLLQQTKEIRARKKKHLFNYESPEKLEIIIILLTFPVNFN